MTIVALDSKVSACQKPEASVALRNVGSSGGGQLAGPTL